MSGDHRDLVIAMLADAELEAQAAAVQYRRLSVAAIERIAELTRERDRLRESNGRLLDAHRALDERKVDRPGEAA